MLSTQKYITLNVIKSHQQEKANGSNLFSTRKINKYTLENFLEIAKQIHCDKFDYSLITSNHVKGWNSKMKDRTCSI